MCCTVGTWYPIEAPGYICANEKPYHGSMRLGKENSLLVFLDGGGGSWCEYTAARPSSRASDSKQEYYYIDEIGPVSVMNDRPGLTNAEAWNLFANWNTFIVHYGTADFHIGNREFPYTDLEQREKTLHHCGYRNFQLILDQAKAYCPTPEKLLVAGTSAGAFGAAALAEEIIQAFPQCKDISCCIDGGLIYADWKKIASTVWNAPKAIYEKMNGPDMVLDCLMALNRKYAERVRCLYISSTRDAVLAWFQKALDGEVPAYTQGTGIQYQKKLTQTCAALMAAIPKAGLYIYDDPCVGLDIDVQMGLTQHTILTSSNIIDSCGEKPSVMQWLWNCVHGKVEQIGLELLK